MTYSTPHSYPSMPPQGPVPAAGAPKRRNTVGLVSLILAIVAFVGAFIPFFNYVAGLIAVVALVLGVIGLFLVGRGKGTSIAGLIIGFIALLVAIVLAIVYTFVFFGNLATSIGDGSGSSSSGIDGSTRDISLIYQVDGTGSDVTVSYTTYTDDISATQQQTGQSLPFEEEYTVGTGGASTYNSYTLTATNGGGDGDVICRIILDGTVIAEETSTGAYATASCTASGTAILPK